MIKLFIYLRFNQFGYIFLISMVISLLGACENTEENEILISRNNTSESHNLGQNCMNCHTQGGDGEGWFTIAGSLYNNSKIAPYPNGSVKIYSEPNGQGTHIKTIEIDSKGNFFTTENIDFANGLYVGVFGTNGEQKWMNSKITSGACNSCHGNSTNVIWME